jgi:hypothetical protein
VPPKQHTPGAIARVVEAMSPVSDAAMRGGFILEKVLGPQFAGSLDRSPLPKWLPHPAAALTWTGTARSSQTGCHTRQQR